MKKNHYPCSLFLILILFPAILFSQSVPVARWPQTPSGNYRCFTDEADTWRRQQNGITQSNTSFENWISLQVQQLQDQQTQNRATPIVYTIPVIFHIIHNGEPAGTGTNIAAAQVNAQIQQLNNDFRKIAATSGYNNHAFGADVQIQFCAAGLSPADANLGETGIERINRNTKGWNAPPFTVNYLENTIKPNSIWDPAKYLNVWVCDFGPGLLGYAQFPDAPNEPGNPASNVANTDGVVIIYNSVGSSVNKFPGGYPYDEGRTLTHEIGHWLGLRHIWGDGNCTTDDFIFDTPRSAGPNFGCPAANTNSCNDITYGSAADSNDMVKNYMDYTDDACMNIYTIGQRNRMRVVMGETGNGAPRRASLRFSDRCQAGPLVSFVTTDTTVMEKTNCNLVWAYAIPVKISRAPAALTSVKLNIGGTANGQDYSITPDSVTFDVSDITDKYFSIAVNPDAVMEGHETVFLNLNVNGSNATGAGDPYEMIIMNDDWQPFNGKRTVATLLSEDFENTPTGWINYDYVAGNNKWLLGGTNGNLNGNKSAYISKDNSSLQYDAGSTSHSLFYREVDASQYDSLNLSFWYVCKGEKDANGIYDYGKIVYSTDSITFHQLTGTPDLVDSTNMTYFSTPVPYFLWNKKFYIGFYWENDNIAGNNPSFAIDDIMISGRRWMPSMIHTAVDTTSGYDEKPLGPMQTVDFYDKQTGDILATIQDIGGYNWGCVKVEVDRSGTFAQWVTGDPQTVPQTKLFDKTYKVTPTNNNTSGQYNITFYLTQQEVTGWMGASANPLHNANMIKFNDRINNMTYTSTYEEQPITRAAYLGGSNWQFTSQFNTGFSGFGFGHIPQTPLPVHIISFSGREHNKMVDLLWKAENETNLRHYKVMRSHDGRQFEEIGTISPAGTNGALTEYTLVDQHPYSGKNFYQLVSYDNDGSFRKSQVIQINIESTNIYTISPNPFKDNITIKLSDNAKQQLTVKLSDVTGRIVLQKDFINPGSQLKIRVPDAAKGIYFLMVTDASGNQAFKLYKE